MKTSASLENSQNKLFEPQTWLLLKWSHLYLKCLMYFKWSSIQKYSGPQKTAFWTCSKHTYTEQNSTLSSSTAWIREVPWILWNKEGKFVLANPSASVVFFFLFLRLQSRWEWKHDKINKLLKTDSKDIFSCFLWPYVKRKSGPEGLTVNDNAGKKKQYLYIYCNLPASGRSERSVCLTTPLLAGFVLL